MSCILQWRACRDVSSINVSSQLNEDVHSLNEATACSEWPVCLSALYQLITMTQQQVSST